MNIINKTIWNMIKNNEEINLTNIIDKLPNIDEKKIEKNFNKYIYNSLILEKLKNIPLVKQRTNEWIELRKNRLTASNLSEAISENNDRIAKKKAEIIIDNINFNNVPAIKWGVMFESMAARCYSQLNDDIKINEFGLILNEDLNCFAASPDGITELGDMIEIKCPYSRKIDGNIPNAYYLQMQGQMAVCNLKKCIYIECSFIEYENKEKYLEEKEENNINYGVIAEFKDNNNDFYYLYSKEYLNKEETIIDIENKRNDCNYKFIKFHYWKLKEINIKKVKFNEKEWNEIIKPKIIAFWEKVENYKKNKKPNLFIEDDD